MSAYHELHRKNGDVKPDMQVRRFLEWQAKLEQHLGKVAFSQQLADQLIERIICGNCGLNMSYHDYGTPSVCCNHRRSVGKHSKCDRTVYEARHIIGIVSHALRTKLAMFRTLNEVLRGDRANKENETPDRSRMLERELENLKAKKIYLYESYAEGHIGKEEYLNKKQEMTKQMETLEQKKAVLASNLKENDDLLSGVEEIAAQAEDIAGDYTLTIEMADTFIDTVVIYAPKHIEVHFTFEDLLQEAGEKAGEILKQKESGEIDWLRFCLVFDVPFGIPYMLFVIPIGGNPAGSATILILNLIVGAAFGCVIAMFAAIRATGYLIWWILSSVRKLAWRLYRK